MKLIRLRLTTNHPLLLLSLSAIASHVPKHALYVSNELWIDNEDCKEKFGIRLVASSGLILSCPLIIELSQNLPVYPRPGGYFGADKGSSRLWRSGRGIWLKLSLILNKLKETYQKMKSATFQITAYINWYNSTTSTDLTVWFWWLAFCLW